MDKHAEHFVETLVKELEEENVAIFAGAGLSVGAGYVDWKKLLQPIAQDLELDIDQEHDLVMTTRQEFRCEVCGLVTTRTMLHNVADQPECWPALPLDSWKDTYATLHMWTQMVGKVRLRLTPLMNHWWNVPLYVAARGLTTSRIPY